MLVDEWMTRQAETDAFAAFDAVTLAIGEGNRNAPPSPGSPAVSSSATGIPSRPTPSWPILEPVDFRIVENLKRLPALTPHS